MGFLKNKLFPAAVLLLLGLILAIGYPTGGVKDDVVYTPAAVQKQVSAKDILGPDKNEKKKKRVVKPLPPPTNPHAQDEGC